MDLKERSRNVYIQDGKLALLKVRKRIKRRKLTTCTKVIFNGRLQSLDAL